MAKITKEEALRYHAEGKPGKIEVIPTKPHSTQTDLSLAYSPGVAEPCLEIEKNPLDAYEYTAKGNLVAVISNGTAVLGLGDIGPLAGKPVMEGKGLLFKIFAGIDVFDIEVNEKDPEKFIQTVKAISPTFGGINLQDLKAPECFEIETRLTNELDLRQEDRGRVDRGERRRSHHHILYETVRDAGSAQGEYRHVRQQGRYLYQPPGLERRQAGVRYRPPDQDLAGGRGGSRRILGPLRGERIDQGDGT